MTARANYRSIGGPDGLLARKRPFEGNTMSAYLDDRGGYHVISYSTEIATWTPGEGADVPDAYYSRTTTKQQNLCRAWL